MDNIDKIALNFAEVSETIKSALITEFLKIYRQNSKTPEAMIQTLLDENIGNYILNDLGLAGEYEKVIESYAGIAAQVTETIRRNANPFLIAALKDVDGFTFYEHVRDVGQKLKDVMVKGALSGMSEQAMKEQLLSATKQLSDYQVGSLVNTNLRTLSRAAFANAANTLPANAKYRYVGPDDDKTRPFCAEHVNKEYTRAEAEAMTNDQGGSAWIEGGGFNCRHSWELVIEVE